jgi:hypothetical protein
VPESELVPDLDVERLSSILRDVRQGDLLDIAKVTFLWSPDAPSHPSEVEGVDHEEPVMTEEMRLATGLCVVASQDCDIRRLPDIEPYIVLCPVHEASESEYRRAADGTSVRLFAYPQLEGHEGKKLVVDGRFIQSIEKTAVLSDHIQRTACPLSEPARTRLREWLGRRLGRDVYPEEVVRSVVAPVTKGLARARELDQEGVFPCILWMGLRWTPGKPYCSLLLLTDPMLRERNSVGAHELDLMLNRLRKALNHFFAKAGGDYTIIANIHDADTVRASDVFEFHEIAIDLDGPGI